MLSNKHNFFGIIRVSDDVDIDGSYLVFDSNRKSIFRSGMTEVGLKRKWKERVNGSMRNNHTNRCSKFYKCYPNSNIQVDNIPDKDDSLGTFQQLGQLIGIFISINELTSITKLFNWSPIEYEDLNSLQSATTKNTLPDKKYRHLCYLFECAYALAIDPRCNISDNPGCEWQLKYYRY